MSYSAIRYALLSAPQIELAGDELWVAVNHTSDRFANDVPEAIRHAIEQYKARTEWHEGKALLESFPTYGLMKTAYIAVADAAADVRKLAGDIVKMARKLQIKKVIVDWTDSPSPLASALREWCEGMNLANYERDVYKQKAPTLHWVEEVVFILPTLTYGDEPMMQQLEHAIMLAQAHSEGVCLARDLVNLPGNMLVPAQLAAEVERVCAAFDCFQCEVLDEQQAAALGMGGLLAVGKGSVHPPRLICVSYDGDPDSEQRLGLIGKGITFDTGGISLKRSDNMAEMICDMAGAATVVGVLHAVGRLRPNINLLFVIASAENMPAGNAYKPGDIITTMSGKTIEVLNTDAEGRVVLADAMTYALQKGANRLIDVATLTGAVLVCLADLATGAVTNDESFLQELLQAAEAADERVWQLPVYPEFKEMIKSSVADVKNTGGRYGGTITGGLFIGTFAGKTPWIHLDIAGTAFLEKPRGIHPKGGTGAIVRTLLRLLETIAKSATP
jgi:leucyl aminopeptidase